MAQKHEDILSIDQFLGLNQSADNLRLSYAADGYNFSVKHGVLQSVKTGVIQQTENKLDPDYDYTQDLGEYETLDARKSIRMLGKISQRWKDGYSGAIPADITWLITVLHGKIYARKHVGGTNVGFFGTDWIEVYDGAFQKDLFDCVAYELNYAPPEMLTNDILIEVMNKTASIYAYDADDYAYHMIDYHLLSDDNGNTTHDHAYYLNNAGKEVVVEVGKTYIRRGYDYPVDAIVMSNSKDGMYLVYCPPQGAGNDPVLRVNPIKIQPSGETHEMKFGTIARFAERIWGAGIDTDPDKMVYSAPYDIFNWEQNNNEPEDGAGDIQQPDWDGDRFTALKAFGNQLVCFKKNSIWAITGSNPSTFYMRKQYGHGTIYEDSIAVYNGNVFFVTDTGLHAYDAVSVNPVKYGYLSRTFEEFSSATNKAVVGCMCSGKYYFNLMTYHAAFGERTFFCYDTIEGTITSYKNGIFPFALMEFNDQVHALHAHDSKFVISNLSYGSTAELYYQTAWQDFGAKNVVKSEFEVYIMPSVEFDDNVEMEIGIETEYKKKAKTVMLTSNRVKRIKLNAKGRKFRFWIKAKEQYNDWKLAGGVQISYSLDYD